MINASEIFSLPFMMFVYSIVLNGGIVQHSISLTKDEDEELINQFYNYFEDGYKFEEFLKAYLEKIGLEEVVITQRSRDGGIDLTAVHNGISDLGGQDYIKYCVQAKRYKPSSNISIDTVKAFAYNVDKYHSTGIFITTAKFSKPTRIEFEKLRNPPIILIDGKTLIEFVNAIEEVCGYYGIKVKNLYKESGIDVNIPIHKTTFAPDGLHLNKLGHEKISNSIESDLESL